MPISRDGAARIIEAGGNLELQKIAYVIPTKDRRADLAKLLESLRLQTIKPDQFIVVDGGDDPVEDLCRNYPDLPLTYVREYPPSLARQRNAGMAALNDDITIAGYLDDDLELAANATEEMLAFWSRSAEDVGGVAFAIDNQPRRKLLLGWLSNFFLINGSVEGRVLRSGFSTSIGPTTKDLNTEWLYGGATLWRREVIREFAYDEWYIGHGYLEDLDFSYRVAQKYKLWVASKARVCHWPHPIRLDRNKGLGRQQVLNRIYFARKMGTFSKTLLIWALFGQMFLNLLQTLKAMDKSGLYRFMGNIEATALILKGYAGSDGEVWK